MILKLGAAAPGFQVALIRAVFLKPGCTLALLGELKKKIPILSLVVGGTFAIGRFKICTNDSNYSKVSDPLL